VTSPGKRKKKKKNQKKEKVRYGLGATNLRVPGRRQSIGEMTGGSTASKGKGKDKESGKDIDRGKRGKTPGRCKELNTGGERLGEEKSNINGGRGCMEKEEPGEKRGISHAKKGVINECS